jgi:hypothetical protein
MASRVAELFKGRRFGLKTRKALELVGAGCSVRKAAETVGLRSWQDVARYAQELGLGRRRVLRRVTPRARSSAA